MYEGNDDTLLDCFDADWFRRLRRNLKRWYRRHARDLPWRKTPDPYRVWISEIMLQQTTVAAVIPYYERFLRQFPDVSSLAAARQEQVLQLWEGLGYYSRARNIHKTAGIVVGQYDAQFPQDVASLMKLPGIGRYTAGAIASFAFDRRAPIVEANTLRLYSRLLGYEGDPRSAEGQRLLWDFAETVLPQTQPGEFNQALMELGGTLCSPKEPSCEQCPVKSCCQALPADSVEQIPRPAVKPETTPMTDAYLAIHAYGKYLLWRRGETEWWTGLWDFPRFNLATGEQQPESRSSRSLPQQGCLPKDRRVPTALASQLQKQMLAEAGLQVAVDHFLTEFRHSVTRYRIRVLCLLGSCDSSLKRMTQLKTNREYAWVSPAEFGDYPLTTTARRLANLLAADAESAR